ncbi:unnamed protein product [Bursaphelenchus okinawaensis]|uniref:Uncharacterized protein n=1 Tax=Bursaphelenchus okinawaensis TaxID=465554 RepID=A0A811LD92_9BILA|nr:unnamed protein product [Bursaphelenchus okinawaensis]CAG9121040.1 unnamed protein product [Bursaphelenchus okinawaensis]
MMLSLNSPLTVEPFPERQPVERTWPEGFGGGRFDFRIEVLKKQLGTRLDRLRELINKKNRKAQKRAATYSCEGEPPKKVRCLEPEDDTFMDFE